MPLDTKAYLEKFGWQQGKGLGKDGEGIKESIRTSKKDDKIGVGGHEDFGKSWEDIFNKAAQNVSVVVTSEGVSMKKSEEGKLRDQLVEKNTIYGGTFLRKTASLKVNETKTHGVKVYEMGSGDRTHLYHDRSVGKLKRLEQQEAEFLAKYGGAAVGAASQRMTAGVSTESAETHKEQENKKDTKKKDKKKKDKKKSKDMEKKTKEVKVDETSLEETEADRKRRKKEKKEKKRKRVELEERAAEEAKGVKKKNKKKEN